MKKIILILISLSFAFINAQTGGFNYKALITDNNNPLSNQQVVLRFTLINDGTDLYQETQTLQTDANGIVTAIVGEGNPVFGDFTDISWNNDIDLSVEVDSGNGFVNFGTEDLKFVPYAKYAEFAENGFSGNYNDLSNKPVTFYAVGTTNPPTDITQDMFHTGGVIIGDFDNSGPRMLDAGAKLVVLKNLNNAQNDIKGIKNLMNIDNLNANTSIGFENSQIIEGTGYVYGVSNEISYNGQGYGNMVGTFNNLNGTGQMNYSIGIQNEILVDSGLVSGILTNITNNSDENSNAIENSIYNNGTGRVIGIKNYLNGQTDVFGMYNTFEGTTDAHHTGVRNTFENSGVGDNVGVGNEFNTGSGKQVGLVNFINNDESDFQAGTVSLIDNDANGNLYGHLVNVQGAGNANIYVVADTIANTGNGDHYGLYNFMTGTGNGMKIGVWSTIDPNAGGQHYAIYGSATKSGSYAGYFNGDVRVSQKLLSNDSGNADTKAYVYGMVNSDGTIVTNGSSMGFQVEKITTTNGYYKITFTNPLLNSNDYIVIANRKLSNAGDPVLTTGILQQNGYFEILFRDYQGTGVDTAFNFVVYRK